MRVADVGEEGVRGGFGGAQVGEQRAGVGREGIVFRQGFEPEDAGQTGVLDFTEHGEPDDRGGIVEEAHQGRQLRNMLHGGFLPAREASRQQGSPRGAVF